MDNILKNKIDIALQHPKSLEIINSSDFYFQKAKDALHDFLDLEVNEEAKQYLLANRKNYNELKQLFEDSLELANFGKLLFTVISYCDTNAHKKRELNAYDDKRVLALAFVRMNNWVEQLITYKFERKLFEGSVKNAVDYLLHPLDNFTMLSEYHRRQLSQNLFSKPYNKSTFKDDFYKFFTEFSITVKNPENYTYLITSLCYFIEKEWKDSIVGLISPDTTGWQENAINQTRNGDYIVLWNHKRPNGSPTTLKLLRQSLEENGFFRVFYTGSHKVQYVAEIVDFVESQDELNKANWPENFGTIKEYDNNFLKYEDGSKSAKWIYLARKIVKVNPEEYSNFQYYKSFGYPSVGCQAPIVSFKNSHEINLINRMNNNTRLLTYKKQIILQGPPGTGKTREAKLIAKEMLGLEDVKDLKDNDQFKLIQFHASYTYEDFVRGITAKSDGDKIEYKNENRVLGKFANTAQKNYLDSKKEQTELSKENWLNAEFEKFIKKISVELNTNGKYELTKKVFVYQIEEDCFRYKGEDWTTQSRINFVDLKKIILSSIDNKDKKFEILEIISTHAWYRQSYYMPLLNEFYDSATKYENQSVAKIDLKNYVLIIDEINRANLSSVLGELIYALEYRGEAVESMYAVDNDTKLILPPNLYIIGTMNTADRSVGHIDYAIRRRFAFVDVLPKELNEDPKVKFHKDLFKAVSELFIEQFDPSIDYAKEPYKLKRSNYLSNEFEPKDIWLGHSYFIDKANEPDGVSMDIRLDYEIKPILLEYVKDGILLGKDINEKIEILKDYL